MRFQTWVQSCADHGGKTQMSIADHRLPRAALRCRDWNRTHIPSLALYLEEGCQDRYLRYAVPGTLSCSCEPEGAEFLSSLPVHQWGSCCPGCGWKGSSVFLWPHLDLESWNLFNECNNQYGAFCLIYYHFIVQSLLMATDLSGLAQVLRKTTLRHPWRYW